MNVTIPAPSKPKKSKIAESILTYINGKDEKTKFTVTDIADKLKQNRDTVYMLLYVLFRKGLLKRIEDDKTYLKSEKWSPEIAGYAIREHYDSINKKYKVPHKKKFF